MGRTKYTEEERNQIMITFIRAAKEILETEGIENVSIRKVANLTGMNSATMYLYFPDSDVLVTMASMGYLEKYCRALSADMPKMQTPQEAALHTWEVFSRYAFESPEIFYHIFYTEHSVPLSEIVDEYYRLFPDQLQNIGGNVREMLHEGPLEERSWKILRPAAEASGMSEQDARIANDMLVAYFRALLEDRCKDPDGMLKSAQLCEKMKSALIFIMNW
jgi:AcrR family transcriptional regulator